MEGRRLHLFFLGVVEALYLEVQKEQTLEVVVVDERQEEDFFADHEEKVVHLMLPYNFEFHWLIHVQIFLEAITCYVINTYIPPMPDVDEPPPYVDEPPPP